MELPRILPLPPHVVDKIAAGEVIQRPFSAVKELVENSVDAQSTQVTVTVKGLTAMLQVQDNGHGIHPDDLNLLCKRFNTSKLKSFDDLKQMRTYGFRGEALASMSHVAKVTITTQKPDQALSYRASYKDGSIVGKPQKCAGVPGTTITIEDLFYNVPQRLRALRSAAEEYNKILDVVQKYSIHHSGRVGFTVKRAAVRAPDLLTFPTATLRQNIAKIYGADVARELIDLECTSEEATSRSGERVFESLTGAITNPNYSRKKGEFLLFINGRLVESSALKRIVDNAYAECLPKGGHPFVYLDLKLPLENLDVNVHPTKREVQFLHESEICDAVNSVLQRLLLGGNESRVFEVTQLGLAPAVSRPPKSGEMVEEEGENNNEEAIEAQDVVSETKRVRVSLPSSGELDEDDEKLEDENTLGRRESAKPRSSPNLIDELADEQEDNLRRVMSSSKKKRADNKLVRTDTTVGSGMERFIVSADRDANTSQDATPSRSRPAAYVITDSDLENAPLIVSGSDALELGSVKTIRDMVQAKNHSAYTDMLKRSVFVGVVDQRFSLIQADTSLLAVDHVILTKEVMYQRVLTLFGRFRLMQIEPPMSVLELLDNDEGACISLLEKGDLLYEYYGIDMRGGDGRLKAIPRLFADYIPQPWCLVKLMQGLANKVNWEDETQCFDTIARQIAEAYSELPEFRPLITSAPNTGMNVQLSDKSSLQHIIKNVVFLAWKSNLLIPNDFTTPQARVLVPLAKLEQLYRIFERC